MSVQPQAPKQEQVDTSGSQPRGLYGTSNCVRGSQKAKGLQSSQKYTGGGGSPTRKTSPLRRQHLGGHSEREQGTWVESENVRVAKPYDGQVN